MILFAQEWDIAPGRERDYEYFITNEFMGRSEGLGLRPVGGFYVEVGFGPRIISVRSTETLIDLVRILESEAYRKLILELGEFTTHYDNRVLSPTGRVDSQGYAIQKGVWKYLQYWLLLPGRHSEYKDFIATEYLPILYSIDYMEVTNSWDVLLGGAGHIVGELTFKSAVDIGRLLEDPDFRNAIKVLRQEFVCQYETRIIRTTERFEDPRWYRL